MKDHPATLRTEPIQKAHKLKSFDCGEKSLNEYLIRYAFKNDQNDIAKTFILADSEDDVLGYYSICAASIEFSELPEAVSVRLPKYPISAALITRLAVATSAQGNDYGSRLLIDALQRIVQAADELGIKLVIVDALHAKAKAFYRHYGFQSFPGNDLKLFLPIETIREAVTGDR